MFIFNLHGIGAPRSELSPNEQAVWLDPSQFEALLDYVKNQLQVELTFDDSNESDFSIALPALRARGLKARFFVVADRVDRPHYLSRSQIEALLTAGMEIGSHGMRHRPWSALGKDELHEELVEAKDRLEQLTGRKILRASCPFGSYNRRVLRGLRRAGYERVYTSDGGPARDDSFLVPRNSVSRTQDLETLKAMVHETPGGIHRVWRPVKLFLKRWR